MKISGGDTAGLLIVLGVVGYVGYQVITAAAGTTPPDPDAWLCYYGPPTDQDIPGIPATPEPAIPVAAPSASTAGTSRLGNGMALRGRCYPPSRDLVLGVS